MACRGIKFDRLFLTLISMLVDRSCWTLAGVIAFFPMDRLFWLGMAIAQPPAFRPVGNFHLALLCSSITSTSDLR